MKVINETPFSFAPFPGKVIYPKDTLTLIIKGTFRLIHEQPAEPAPKAQQLPPTGDLHYDDDPHAGCRYASDFVHFKPKADVLVVGHCQKPGGQLVEAAITQFSAGPVQKSLMVFGDRYWRRTRVGTRTMSDPVPFEKMELRYEHSFGGPDYAPNPLGKGIRPRSERSRQSDHEMANIKVLTGEQLKTMPQGIPAGFGPLGRTWTQRMAFVGTYDEKWQKERWPWLPEDFDWAHFNAAPADQQVKGYLTGDERLWFENLHPVHTEFQSALPGVRVRCFLSQQQDRERRIREVHTQLDTLWADMDNETLVLVWRGLATVSPANGDDTQDLLIVQEPVDEAPRPEGEYLLLLHEREAAAVEAQAQAEALAEAPGETVKEDEAASAALAQETAALDSEITNAMSQLHKALAASDLDPKLVAAATAEKDPERFAALLLKDIDNDPSGLEKLRASSMKQAKQIMKEQGHDPDLLDSLTADPFAADAEAVSSPPDKAALAELASSPGAAADHDLDGADFSGMALDGADFKSARLENARFTDARLAGADFSGASLGGADFSNADMRGARLAQTDLSGSRLIGARLEQADLAQAVMTDSDLSRAVLSNAQMSGALLGNARLTGANLSGARLEQADLTGADLTNADLTEAVIEFALLDDADLTQADLTGAKGLRTSFNGAVLQEALFANALMTECDFSKCRCDRCNFKASTLTRACFEGAIGHRVNFREARLDHIRAGERAQLPGAVFRRASGQRGTWIGADLKDADLILANMPHCDFSQCNLSGCDGRTADLRQSIFDKAVLSGAKFNRANLFQARLEAADLKGANFKGANLYGSEFLEAAIDQKTSFIDANLKATKLAALGPKHWGGA